MWKQACETQRAGLRLCAPAPLHPEARPIRAPWGWGAPPPTYRQPGPSCPFAAAPSPLEHLIHSRRLPGMLLGTCQLPVYKADPRLHGRSLQSERPFTSTQAPCRYSALQVPGGAAAQSRPWTAGPSSRRTITCVGLRAGREGFWLSGAPACPQGEGRGEPWLPMASLLASLRVLPALPLPKPRSSHPSWRLPCSRPGATCQEVDIDSWASDTPPWPPSCPLPSSGEGAHGHPGSVPSTAAFPHAPESAALEG